MSIDFQGQVNNQSNDELLHIYMNTDEYQEEYIKVVSDELIKSNVNVEEFRQEKEKKIKNNDDQFEKGREGNQIYILLGFISALLGGIIAIIAGYTYSQSKHRDNSGNSYYVYNKHTRDLGRVMMIIGVLVLLMVSIWKFS